MLSDDAPFTKSQTKCSAIEDEPPFPQVYIVAFDFIPLEIASKVCSTFCHGSTLKAQEIRLKGKG